MGEVRNQQRNEEIIEEKAKEEEEKFISVEMENHTGSGEVRISAVNLFDKNQKACKVFRTASDMHLKIEYDVLKKVEKANIGVSIWRNDGLCCYGVSTKQDDIEYFSMNEGGCIELLFPQISLLNGKYYVSVGIEDNIRNSIDFVDRVCEFEIYSVDEEVGAFYLEHLWKVNA